MNIGKKTLGQVFVLVEKAENTYFMTTLKINRLKECCKFIYMSGHFCSKYP
jgi:hypothetical protein